ncbi:DUF1540 domain-containing protein [Brevibacillus dissolubilis]|uniref:DUF1540 domain-containing protein n=1 Tax=Brevibacillus dissolubilis TaxID=1844116 RepID=UPI00210043EF|nr:DUF1540 domain-containing protein [Brevibacillus dissolubilis]
MTQVKCIINSCTHYLYGDRCGARNIDIMHEQETAMSQNVEQTMCKSFSHNDHLMNYLGSADNVNWGGTAMGLVDPAYMVSPSISCTVSSCKYWGEGSLCVANAIEVNGLSNSNECQDTNCGTYERRS